MTIFNKNSEYELFCYQYNMKNSKSKNYSDIN